LSADGQAILEKNGFTVLTTPRVVGRPPPGVR
jgi:hypothetical protein